MMKTLCFIVIAMLFSINNVGIRKNIKSTILFDLEKVMCFDDPEEGEFVVGTCKKVKVENVNLLDPRDNQIYLDLIIHSDFADRDNVKIIMGDINGCNGYHKVDYAFAYPQVNQAKGYIVVDKKFFLSLPDVCKQFLMAHEIAHHKLNHFGLSVSTDSEKKALELAADYNAGYCLGKKFSYKFPADKKAFNKYESFLKEELLKLFKYKIHHSAIEDKNRVDAVLKGFSVGIRNSLEHKKLRDNK